MIILAGHLKTSPEHVEELAAALQSLVADTLLEDGCLDYNFAIQDRAAGAILVYERWRDQDALNTHLALPAIGAVLGGWADRIEIAVRKFDAANERGFTE
ncbi:antibiotic biosynthesis monooxygenase [Novosphingobium sp. KCTC 2891]|uniref:putative quinol monooxygenase n=1 Tax=Novosphingobium sp. KCTC 2891 TaxID=2989730 RepID=UPI0022236595|nr:putative quinol monooxygenase [Novosphingobium sp. KCTC 2891]MCW1381883.1 antibiotic biosynthesis monooxygenase [Novosphingobium sp. KCTC 2891]